MEKLEKALSTRIMKFATRGVKLILGKAKYEKRTGGPGHFKYKYFRERKKTRAKVEAMEERKKKKPISSKKYMKEHAGDIRREADELKRMGQEDFKRKKEEYDKKKKVGKRIANEIEMMSDEGLQRNIDRHKQFKEDALYRMKEAKQTRDHGAVLDLEGKIPQYDNIIEALRDEQKSRKRTSDKRTIREKQKLPESKEKFVSRMKEFNQGFDE